MQKNLGHLNLPLTTSAGTDFPIIQYADDTLLILESCKDQLSHLKSILDAFFSVNGFKGEFLKINNGPN